MKNDRVTVLGAGLAGCEAAFQLAERGIAVSLVEMRPLRRSPAHKTDLFGELVCSNSLRSDRLQNGAGLLKEEMRRMGSLIVSSADETRVPAGGALAVDRQGFARLVTERIRNHPNITVVEAEAEVSVFTIRSFRPKCLRYSVSLRNVLRSSLAS